MNSFITNSRFFIKKVWFPGEDDTICELISVNKEITDQTSILNVEVIASFLHEFKHETEEFLDIKKYITQEEAELLTELVSDEPAFLERVNNIIQ